MKNVYALQRHGLLTDQQALRAYQFVQDPSGFSLVPSQFRILQDLLIDEVPLGVYEARCAWPSRSAKAVLKVLLSGLSEVRGTTFVPKRTSDPVTLAEEVEYLKADNFMDIVPAIQEFGFTLYEARLFLILKRAPGGQASREALLTRLYSDQIDDSPQIKTVDVFICKIRRKLQGTIWKIETVWGIGYRLEKAKPDLGQTGPPVAQAVRV